MPPKHVNNGACPRCALILADAHPKLQAFAKAIQAKTPSAHVAWAHRTQKDQDDAYRRGTSKLKWPESKHNAMPARAIDFFELDVSGARWDARWMKETLEQACVDAGLTWGGSWAKFRDYPHVEMKD